MEELTKYWERLSNDGTYYAGYTKNLHSGRRVDGMHVIYPAGQKEIFKKRQTAGIMAAVLLIQSVFLVMTDDIKIYFWIPCMIVAVFLMIVFIYSCCENYFYRCCLFWDDRICCRGIYGIVRMAGCMLLFRRGDDKLVALQRSSCSDLWCNRTDPV